MAVDQRTELLELLWQIQREVRVLVKVRRQGFPNALPGLGHN